MSQILKETRLMFNWNLRMTLRNPVWPIFGLIQPILYLLLFAPLLDNLGNGIPKGEGLNIFTPGLLVMMGMFNAAFAGIYILESLQNGVLERMRVTPISRTALLLGLLLRDVLVFLFECAILIAGALLLGLDPDPFGLVLLFAMLALINLTIGTLSYGLALAVRNQDAFFQTIQFFVVPLQLLSGILLPMSLAPRILRNISEANPFTHAVEAGRYMIAGNSGDSEVFLAFGLFIVLTLLAFNWVRGSLHKAAA